MGIRHDDPAHMWVDGRLREIASILALGVVRLRKRRLLSRMAQNSEKSSAESAAQHLEFSGETVLSVSRG